MATAIALPLVLAVALSACAQAAYANGRVVRYEQQTAGPYEIGFGTIPSSPVVGSLHLSIRVADASTGAIRRDATVTVQAKGPGPDQVATGPLGAKPNLTIPDLYETTAAVDREGIWTFDVAVSSELGNASIPFFVTVREANPVLGIITLVVLVAFLSVLGLSARSYLGQRRGARRRRSGKGTA